MAIITGAFPGSEGCLGLIVQVVEFAGTRRSSTDNLLHVDAWFLDGPHPGFERSRRQGYRIMHPDRWLRPVSGLPPSDQDVKDDWVRRKLEERLVIATRFVHALLGRR